MPNYSTRGPAFSTGVPVGKMDPAETIKEAVASGVSVAFQWALPVVILAFLVSFLLREVPLREDVNVGAAAVEGMEETSLGVLGEPGAGPVPSSR